MSDIVFPTTYEEWRHCIEELGGISLNRSYIDKRLAELEDGQHTKTREFEKLYGLHKVLARHHQVLCRVSALSSKQQVK